MMQANNFCPAGKKSFTKERLSGKEDAVQGTVQEIKSCHDVSFRVMFLPAAGVAQLAEQLICNQQVAGSSPIASSTLWVKRDIIWVGSRVAKGSRL